MKDIFVNLKRFDVSRTLGGVCASDSPKLWIEWVLGECIGNGIGRLDGINVTFLLPEGLVITAVDKLSGYDAVETGSIKIGCQGVYREDVAKGGNFGAFTTNRPSAAAKALGCSCAIIGHSEERKDKLGIMAQYDPSVLVDGLAAQKARKAVDEIINREVLCALDRDIRVLVCVGETEEEKGGGSFDEQKSRIEAVLGAQLETGLRGVKVKHRSDLVIGYEPVWAIGPGKVPPGKEYISFVSSRIKELACNVCGFKPDVVYGGGLKEENAGMIAEIDTLDGGLVALTRFSGEIGFYPDELKKIINKYISADSL